MSAWLNNLQEKNRSTHFTRACVVIFIRVGGNFLLWSLLLQNSIDARRALFSSQLDTVKNQRQSLDTQIVALSMGMASDPNIGKANTIATLNADIAQLDQDLGKLSQGLVSASELPQILQDVLLRTGELTLVQLQTLPVQELQLSAITKSNNATGAPESGAGVFKHEVSLKVSGNYFQVLKFLQSLEAYQWRFYWERLDYTVAKYPYADIELRVYTLSADKGY